ncbi:hypothetical protein G6F57_012260 [Rhizopus arrhizus]|uniref:Uncharacterized protein n=1 Tax=Rhizopus oryzae TaxID=64495 RepID=A0A9P6WZB4_RHIOR|nr:hypothetical protein G6F23_009690 [Rhizopus arrhizus]KAG0929783.1 hypothetical protein G6F30_011890 [Rhizopus arrhizus]KAG0933729.1 hypothetical protein G6F32_010972 [Rhizopus arrhizus]KAG0974778.1 hypothetical protein G6F29_011992 [Rhizopus arrhizus]KAG0979501.1 hypothetical protein G6F28_011882 [Rhizopus arrhizus]
MYSILNDEEMTMDKAEEAIDEIKSASQNKGVKTASKIISNLCFKLLNNHRSNNQMQGEATLIIENIRPFLNNCIISRIELVKFEWLTYRLTQPSDLQIMIPDLVLFVEPHSATNYELFFVEVKRKGNYQNDYLENDLIKIGKEMHTALNKLVKKKVKNPEVVGLLVEDCHAVAYKMDLEYDGQYRMIEMSRFNFTRDNVDDILLVPAIIEKLNQIKEIIQATINNLYSRINGDEELVDLTPYTRQACKAPVSILG